MSDRNFIFEHCFNAPHALREQIERAVNCNIWICPIRENNVDLQSYYTISKNEIVIADQSEFISDDEYFGVLTHLMAHSVGDFGKNRDYDGAESYAKEELVCECCSAMLLALMGLKKTLNEDSCMYRRIWEKSWNDESFRKEIEQRAKVRFFAIMSNLYK